MIVHLLLSRLRTGYVGPLCTNLRGHECGWGNDILVFCTIHGKNGEFLYCTNHGFKMMSDRKRISCGTKVGWRNSYRLYKDWLRWWIQNSSSTLVIPCWSCVCWNPPQHVIITDKTDSLNLFFCFRYAQRALAWVMEWPRPDHSWVLIAFKREFPFDEVLGLWEVLWTDYYSTEFVLFVALAVLESHREVIIRYLVEVCLPYPVLRPLTVSWPVWWNSQGQQLLWNVKIWASERRSSIVMNSAWRLSLRLPLPKPRFFSSLLLNL